MAEPVLDAAAWALVGSALLTGVVSALTALVPVEVVVVSVAATQPNSTAVAVALAAAVGQTLGKTVIFLAARGARSQRWLPRRLRRRVEHETVVVSTALHRGAQRVTAACVVWLNGRWAPGVVVLSGAVGMPPLMLMAAAAGLSGMPVARFAAACLLGRSLRLLALASVPGLVEGWT